MSTCTNRNRRVTIHFRSDLTDDLMLLLHAAQLGRLMVHPVVGSNVVTMSGPYHVMRKIEKLRDSLLELNASHRARVEADPHKFPMPEGKRIIA